MLRCAVWSERNNSLELLDLKLPIRQLPITNYQLPTPAMYLILPRKAIYFVPKSQTIQLRFPSNSQDSCNRYIAFTENGRAK
ncbi:MAG: hypothetical protein HC849_14380 [Oscillatoriales cyanobacterium RU_3_3]|nr:hypothetical protein [Microcoleus sp. SU_5_6]NJM61124.1 hypothetical protein [Oscillatoriales cyanobacterium RU_3_3]